MNCVLIIFVIQNLIIVWNFFDTDSTMIINNDNFRIANYNTSFIQNQ